MNANKEKEKVGNLPAESELGNSNGKEDNITHPATVKVLSNVTIRARVQLATLNQKQEGVQTENSDQSHEEGSKEDSTVLERIRQEENTTGNKPTFMR